MGKPEPPLPGRPCIYYDQYNPHILHPIKRSVGRAGLKLKNFEGFDLWRLYELTFLNRKGFPEAVCASVKVPASSPYIIESKSMKLYAGSFTMTRFRDKAEVEAVMRHDLGKALDCDPPEVRLFSLEECPFPPKTMPGELIDLEDGPESPEFCYNPHMLKFADEDKNSKDNQEFCEETLRSNLLRTLCPLTSQPDHACISIHYQGRRIDRASLFYYLVSLRTHKGFHEQCCEMIFNDIKTLLKPAELTVLACFTRRGGIDISPLRTDCHEFFNPQRTLRQ